MNNFQQSGFLNQLVTLQILGKFLGFVSFLPYRTDECLTQFDESALIAMKNRVIKIYFIFLLNAINIRYSAGNQIFIFVNGCTA